MGETKIATWALRVSHAENQYYACTAVERFCEVAWPPKGCSSSSSLDQCCPLHFFLFTEGAWGAFFEDSERQKRGRKGKETGGALEGCQVGRKHAAVSMLLLFTCVWQAIRYKQCKLWRMVFYPLKRACSTQPLLASYFKSRDPSLTKWDPRGGMLPSMCVAFFSSRNPKEYGRT